MDGFNNDILGKPDLSKMQEKLLKKGEQNRCFPVKLGKIILVLQYLKSQHPNIKAFGSLLSSAEDVQINIDGYSRSQFVDCIKHMPPETGSNGSVNPAHPGGV